MNITEEMTIEEELKEEFEKKAARLQKIAEKNMLKEVREETKFTSDWEIPELVEKSDLLFAFTKFVVTKEKTWEDAEQRLIIKMTKILKENYPI